ncbi:MAG: 50S ribosomal protein L16 [Candidatus Diapherotrites archaeon]|nr:50S ribosomal protein L16 [Candidatus Diapherotrites archaeon]MDZ4255998.1 50S ribosomal protein L16 [archaeon]
MGLRPAHCYRGTDKPAYTRIAIKVHHKNFIGTNPGLRTRQFNMGNPTKPYSHIVDWVVQEPHVQVRDNAIEAVRMGFNRQLVHKIGKDNFFIRVRVYPFQILRENKIAQGAGADRVSSGMKHSFGKPIGRAVRLRKNQKVLSVLCDGSHVTVVTTALNRAATKFNCKMLPIVHQDVTSIGNLPKKTREEKIEATVTTPVEGEVAAATPEVASKTGGKAPVKGVEKKDAGKKGAKKDAKKK